MKKILTISLIICSILSSNAQTQFWSDTFEDTGAPSSGSRTPSVTFYATNERYFDRVTPAQINWTTILSGNEGSKFFGGADIDNLTGQNTQSPYQNVTWSSINISGKSGMSFKGLFATGTNNNFDYFPGASPVDHMLIEYRIDGGPWTSLVRFFPNIANSGAGALALETTGDSLAQGEGPALNGTFTEFAANIVGTGTLLDLRFRCEANGTSFEEIAIDNLRLFESPACSTPTLNLVSQTNVSCNGGSNGTATMSASGASPFTYTWSPSGGNSAIATGLSAGIYTCVTTNSCGLTASKTVTITQPSALVVNALSQTNISCNGGTNGAASVSASGGTTAYSYNWTPGNPSGDGTASVTGLTAGSWTCTVTDANSCVSTRTFNITQPSALTVNAASQTNISCNGGANGAASVSASGGTTAYSYNWSPGNPTGDGTASVTGLTAGSWTCTVTDANACSNSQTFNITQPSALVVNAASQTNISCNGGSNGAASVSASGGTTAYSYNWTPGNPTGDGTASVTGLTAGSWTCTVTDANACSNSQTFNITQPTAITATTSQTNVACNAGSNGAASVSASGGTGALTYAWSPSGGTGATATGLTNGNYTCTITDANSCSIPKTISITQPAALVTSTAVTNVSCNGGSNGSATVTASGGTTAYTYLWSSAQTTSVISGQTAAVKTVTVTDANGCTSSKSISITQPSAITATTSQTNISCFGGTNGAASVSASGGSGSLSYAWSPSGGTAATATGLASTSYTCTITDANACSITKNITLTQPTAITATTSQTNVACNAGSNGAASVSASGGTGALTYAWSPSGGTSATATSLSSGNYTCTITDANSCSITKAFVISQPAAITANISFTNTSCSANTGIAAVTSVTGGTGAFTYSWSPTGGSAATATNLGVGTYTCLITDANTCTISKLANISTTTGPALTIASQTNVACNSGSNGAAVVNAATGGTGPYTYNWTPGNPTGDGSTSVTGLSSGSWLCTVTDANGCSANQSFNITQPSAILFTTASQTNVACFAGANGVASVNPATGGAGAFSYSWSPSGGSAITATGLSANTYTCKATDANGCSANQIITITQPTQLVLSTNTVSSVSCNGGNNGAASINVTGATPSYAYNWLPGNPTGDGTASISGLTAGNYSCTVTDSKGCSASHTINVSQPATLLLSVAGQNNVTCNGGTNATASVNNATGGTGAVTYSWSPTGGNTISATNLSANTYTCKATDANGCSAIQTFTITEPSALVVSVSSTSITCNGGSADVTVSASGATSPYTGDGSSTLPAGSYTFNVADANGCPATTSITITQPAAITAAQSVTLCAGGSLIVGPSWYTQSGIYTDVLTAANGCDSTVTTNLTVNAEIVSSQTVTLCAGQSFTIGSNTYTATGTYFNTFAAVNGCDSTVTTDLTILNPIVNSQTIVLCAGQTIIVGANTYSATGIYTDVFTAASGCDSTLTTDLTVNSTIDITTTLNGLTITANESSATYQWIDCDNANAIIPGETNQSFTASSNGNYAVIITQNSCSETSTCQNISSVGIKELAANNILNVYPNPTTGVITITYHPQEGAGREISILNTLGETVLSAFEEGTRRSGDVDVKFDISNQPNGIYFIQLKTDNGTITKKIVKN